MKRILVLTIALLASNVLAQSDLNRGHTRNDGLFISGSIGVHYLSVYDKVNTGGDNARHVVSGSGGSNFQIGMAIIDNLVLHADYSFVTGGALNVLEEGSSDAATVGATQIDIRIFGGGATYYLMPANVFFSGTLGFGRFEFLHNTIETDTPFQASLGLKLGKEWWISKNWDLGVSIGANYTRVDQKTDLMTENLSGISIGLFFNATFN